MEGIRQSGAGRSEALRGSRVAAKARRASPPAPRRVLGLVVSPEIARCRRFRGLLSPLPWPLAPGRPRGCDGRTPHRILSHTVRKTSSLPPSGMGDEVSLSLLADCLTPLFCSRPIQFGKRPPSIRWLTVCASRSKE
jgi:hypothetical protein